MAYSIPTGYYDKLAQLESGGNPFAVSPTSSASGLYQFTKSTFEGLGFSWGKRFDVDTQNAAVDKFTQQNAGILQRNGLDISSTNLYAMAFLGQTGGVRALTSPDSAPLSSVISRAALTANPTLQNMTVGDFKKWIEGRFGGNMTNSSTKSAMDAVKDWLSGKGGLLPGMEEKTLGDTAAEADPTGLFDWLRKLFSFETAGRATAVFIGVLLVGLAVAALVLTSDTKPSDLVKKVVS